MHASLLCCQGLAITTAVSVPVAALAATAALEQSGAITTPIASYIHLVGDWVGELGLPEFVIHWIHAINMGVVLASMGGYGTYLGWQIRAGE